MKQLPISAYQAVTKLTDKISFSSKGTPYAKRWERIDNKYFHYHIQPGDPKILLYYFHGLFSKEDDFVTPNFLFGARGFIEVNALNKTQPTIIGISFGSSWMLYDKNEKYFYPKHSTVPFVGEVMRYLESQFNYINPTRLLVGRSMGGFNAIQMWLHRPYYWKRAFFHVPMLVDGDPWNWFDMELLAAPIVRGNLTKEEWPQIDPYGPTMVRKLRPSLPPASFQVGKEDLFKLYKPGLKYYNIVKDAGVQCDIVENPGGHNYLDVDHMISWIDKK